MLTNNDNGTARVYCIKCKRRRFSHLMLKTTQGYICPPGTPTCKIVEGSEFDRMNDLSRLVGQFQKVMRAHSAEKGLTYEVTFKKVS